MGLEHIMSTQAQSFFLDGTPWKSKHKKPTQKENISFRHIQLCCDGLSIGRNIISPILGMPFCQFLLELCLPQQKCSSVSFTDHWRYEAESGIALCYGHHHSGFLGHLDNKKQLNIPANSPSFQRWKDTYFTELNLLKFRMKKKILHPVSIMAGLYVVIFLVCSFLMFLSFSLFSLFSYLLFYFLLGPFFVLLAYLNPVRPAIWGLFI